jgi:hypothetical protein
MDKSIKKILRENLNKSDVNKEIKNYIDTAEFKTKIEKIIKDRIKNEKGLEDKIVDITKNVLVQFYKTLWTKIPTWKDNLTNTSN